MGASMYSARRTTQLVIDPVLAPLGTAAGERYELLGGEPGDECVDPILTVERPRDPGGRGVEPKPRRITARLGQEGIGVADVAQLGEFGSEIHAVVLHIVQRNGPPAGEVIVGVVLPRDSERNQAGDGQWHSAGDGETAHEVPDHDPDVHS
jgi:hypothetical protein